MAADACIPSAHLFPQTLAPSHDTSPNKRPKTETLDSPSHSKGKSKIEGQSTIDFELNHCGICLSEEGFMAIRGWIDTCEHYFCFVCIMEWAKVESRCPMCKRRFSTIRRPPKEGVFLSERVVSVPVRDQVYHCLGNATTGPTDLYSEVQCSVCHSATDESLLLLCDLCDSAAHTYCVGLGATVPEGDWFCQDCMLLRAEHSKNEVNTDCDNRTSFHGFHKIPSTELHIFNFDIVQESRATEVERTSMVVSLHRSRLSSTAIPDGGISLADHMTRRGTNVACNATKFCARTLSRCRNVHDRIRALRENWTAFRSGSLSFSSNSVDRCGSVDEKHKIGALPGGSSQLLSASWSSLPLPAHKGSSRDKLHKRDSNDIDKIWKMMEVAKSIKQDHGQNIIVHQASKHTSRKVNGPKEACNISSIPLTSTSQQLGPKNFGSTRSVKHYQYHSLEKYKYKHKSQTLGKQKERKGIMKMVSNVGEVFPTTCSPAHSEFPSSRKLRTSFQVDVCHGIGGHLSQKKLLEIPSNVSNEPDGSACSISLVESTPVASNVFHAKLEPEGSSSSCKVEPTKGKCRMENTCVLGKAKRNNDAKSEIRSLVKLNLKLLSRDKKLEVDAFKEVARLATHSILAACGLEPSKPGGRSFPSSICCHADEVRQLRRSTLMCSSCRECFYGFVKDVVSSIMFEKMVCAEVSC